MGREGKLGLYTAESLLLFPPLFDRFLSFFFRLVVHLILLLPRNLEPSLGVSLPPSLSLSLFFFPRSIQRNVASFVEYPPPR